MAILKLLAVLGQYGLLIYLGATYGIKAALAALGVIACDALYVACREAEKRGKKL